MDKEIKNLLGKLCVDLGFCLPPIEQDRIASLGVWRADEFAKDVISSEGLNPEYEKKWLREIRNRFVAHFGSNEYESKNS
ncbi:hypothetical protein EUZ85_14235 [Hahella sp. KA22]|uniref:hypothetical protein n=1 Tax=Hahella sp. KA22 TaxID=1628392 RepID=UPI000FDF2A61|nr:hypothetical protein [Hahella sp. KA22]AZZ91825.1 hypothetical protein ENC22_11675 [Hahella sp. KA22]QAY55195.1 hypothetical protein EUZ85_14235 [Hahella sp. KA22]